MTCPMKYYWEQGRIDSKWIKNYCFNSGKDCIRYEKEEKGIYHPDQMLPNGEIDEPSKIIINTYKYSYWRAPCVTFKNRQL